jgi:hypothetical protein
MNFLRRATALGVCLLAGLASAEAAQVTINRLVVIHHPEVSVDVSDIPPDLLPDDTKQSAPLVYDLILLKATYTFTSSDVTGKMEIYKTSSGEISSKYTAAGTWWDAFVFKDDHARGANYYSASASVVRKRPEQTDQVLVTTSQGSFCQ